MRGIFRNKLAMFGLAIIMLMSGCYIAIPSGSWHYKVTVEIETPEGIKTGSAVRSVSMFEVLHTSESVPTITPRGEAVVIDLGKRGLVFATLDVNEYRVVFDAFPDPGRTLRETLRYYSHLKNAKTVIMPRSYPVFVAFKNLNDPSSVLNLREPSVCAGKYSPCPWRVNDRFEEIFGEGVRLKSVSVEMTGAPITLGIEKILPWLPGYYNQLLDGHKTINVGAPFANTLGAGSFSTELVNDE